MPALFGKEGGWSLGEVMHRCIQVLFYQEYNISQKSSITLLIDDSCNVIHSLQLQMPSKQIAGRNTCWRTSPQSVQRLFWVSVESLFKTQCSTTCSVFRHFWNFTLSHLHKELRKNQQISVQRRREKNRSSIQSVFHYLLTMCQWDGNQRGIPVSALKSKPNYSKLLACP